jgi:hypothetical protein
VRGGEIEWYGGGMEYLPVVAGIAVILVIEPFFASLDSTRAECPKPSPLASRLAFLNKSHFIDLAITPIR